MRLREIACSLLVEKGDVLISRSRHKKMKNRIMAICLSVVLIAGTLGLGTTVLGQTEPVGGKTLIIEPAGVAIEQ